MCPYTHAKFAFILVFISLLPSNQTKADCIGVVSSGGGSSFWELVKQGAEAASRELELVMYFRGPIDEGGAMAQGIIIDSIFSRNCVGLVLAPNSLKRAEQVNRLKKLGIPTVYIDRDGPGERYSIIKTNNFSAGMMAGLFLAKILDYKGNVAVFRMDKGVGSTSAREAGFIQGAQEGGLVVYVDTYLGTDVGEARTKAAMVISQHPNIKGIFTPNESTTLATLGARKQVSHSKETVHIGFDSHKYILNAIRDGWIYGVVVQHPYQMGYQAVHTLHSILNNEQFDKQVQTATLFVNKDNIDSADIRKIISP